MRIITRTAIATLAGAALVTTAAACSSSGGSSGSSDSAAPSSNTSSSSSSSAAAPYATIPSLSHGISTSVKLDAGFVKALTSLKVTPTPFGTAKIADGSATFPITGGNVKLWHKGEHTPYVEGTIDHEGSGLNLKAGSTTVTIENFVIDPGNNSKLTGDVLVNGKSFAKGAELFVLDGTTLQTPTIDSSTGVATLTGTRVLLSKTAAGALNTAFGIKSIPANLLIGVATIKAATK